MKSWLPPPPARPRHPDRPWKPPALARKRVRVDDLTYIVVDEIVGDVLGLSLHPWPSADDQGRLRFDTRRPPARVSVPLATWCSFLTRRGLRFTPGSADRRGPRVGDAFGARVAGPVGRRWRDPLDRWVRGPIHDLTLEARKVAKLSYYGSATGRWSREQVEAFGLKKPRRRGS